MSTSQIPAHTTTLRARIEGNVPPELLALPQWVGWRYSSTGRKIPIDVKTNEPASSVNPETWASVEQALDAYDRKAFPLDGVGFVFTHDDPYVGLDLDKCRNPETGMIEDRAWDIVQEFATYTEVSPSLTGLKLWIKGTLPAPLKLPGYEMYQEGRYFTVTGDIFTDSAVTSTVREAQAELDALYVRLRPPTPPRTERPLMQRTTENASHIERYILAALEGERAKMMETQDGFRHIRRFNGAMALAGFLHYGVITEQDIFDAMAVNFGQDVKSAEKAIWDGIAYGATQERYVPDLPKPDAPHMSNGYACCPNHTDRPLRQGKRSGYYCSALDDAGNYCDYAWFDELPITVVLGARTVRTMPRQDDKAVKFPPVHIDDTFNMLDEHIILDALNNGEFGDAQLLITLYQDRLVYDYSEKSWFFWHGHSWVKDVTEQIKRLVQRQLKDQYIALSMKYTLDMGATTDKEEAKRLLALTNVLQKRANALNGPTRVTSILSVAQTLAAITSDRWDSNPWLLGVKNGIVDLKTGELRPGNPKDFIQKISPFAWTGLDTPAPRWEAMLHSIFEDHANPAETVAFLHRLMGYAITGVTTEAVLPIFYGEEGRNGKSVMLEVLGAILGKLSVSVSPDILLHTKNGAGTHTAALCALQGARLAWSNETNEGNRMDSAQVKKLTGGDRLPARQPYGQQFEFFPSHTLFLLTNRLPHATADDSALWERLIAIPFNMRFVDNPTQPNDRPRDPELKRKLLEHEATGILAWMVRGCLAWQAHGLKVPQSLRVVTAQYRTMEDDLRMWIDDCCIEGADCVEKSNDLYSSYREWCRENGMKDMNVTAFGKRMVKLYQRNKMKYGNVYIGIRLMTPADRIAMGAALAAETSVDGWRGGGFEGVSNDFLYTQFSLSGKSSEDHQTIHPTEGSTEVLAHQEALNDEGGGFDFQTQTIHPADADREMIEVTVRSNRPKHPNIANVRRWISEGNVQQAQKFMQDNPGYDWSEEHARLTSRTRLA